MVVHELSCPAAQHVGSSWTRDQTSIPCIARQILNHWTTREAPCWKKKKKFTFKIQIDYNVSSLGSYTFGLAMLCYAKSLQSCLTLCDPIDGSPTGSPVPEILQARTLEWVVISFSSAWKWKLKVKSLSRVRPSATPWTAALQAPPSMGFSRQEYWSEVPLLWPYTLTLGSYRRYGILFFSVSCENPWLWFYISIAVIISLTPPLLHPQKV